MRTGAFEYEPDGDVLIDFHLATDFAQVILGPLGSAKTTACCCKILTLAMNQTPANNGIRYSRWLVIRSTYPELETTTIKSWRDLFGDEWGRMTWGHPPRHEVKFALGDGTTVHLEMVFMALDGPEAEEKIRGGLYTGIWANELNTIRRPIITMALGRAGRFPSMKDGGPTWHGMLADTNMPDEDHWVYKMAEEEHPAGWAFFRQPGGVYQNADGIWIDNPYAENVDNLPPNYYRNQLAGANEDWIKVYLAAEYGFVRDGKPVMLEYYDSTHCVEFDPLPDVPLDLGADFGLTPAAVISQEGPTGQLMVLDEVVMEDAGAEKFGDELMQALNRDWSAYDIRSMTGDPAGNQRAPTDEQTVFDILSAKGLPFVGAETNIFTLRREAVAKPLTQMVDGKPGLIIHPRCRVLRKGMAGGYQFRRLKVADDERYTDSPDKNHYSHVCEALQYLCLGYGKGQELIRKRIKPDMTGRGMQMTADAERPGQQRDF